MSRQIRKLNNIDHASLTVITEYAARWGDDCMSCLAYTTEMRQLQAAYPLLFQMTSEAPDPLPIALLGFTPGENLFLSPEGWDSDVIPMMMRKGPFLIAQEQDQNGNTRSVIAVDESHPKLVPRGGEPLFLEFGGYSDHLEQIVTLLERIEASHDHTLQFAHALNSLELITPIEFGITLRNGEHNTLKGLYGIDEEKVSALSPFDLGTLHDAGFLTPLFMMIASQSQMTRLIAYKNSLVEIA